MKNVRFLLLSVFGICIFGCSQQTGHDRETLPDCFEVSATSEDGEIMGLRHKTLPIESVQYHPESIGTPRGINQLKNFLRMVNP